MKFCDFTLVEDFSLFSPPCAGGLARNVYMAAYAVCLLDSLVKLM